MDRTLGLSVLLLGLNHDFRAFFQDEVKEDHADGNYYEHPRIYNRNEDNDRACVEEALNGYECHDWYNQVKDHHIVGEDLQDTSDRVLLEEADIGTKDSVRNRVL